ncbi:hypothetical protein BH20ACT6_BH20ACT6_06060 [soil metagenome]
MHLDHLSYAAGPGGLDGTTKQLSAVLGEDFRDGGVHPRFGTCNRVLPLASGHYLEVVDVLDHPASDKAAFGQLVRARTEAGGGWLGWVVSVLDIAPVETRLGRPAVQGNRRMPDGFDLRWKQVGVRGLQVDPQLPFVVQWEVGDEHHPSYGASGDIALEAIEIAGDPNRVADWLGSPALAALEEITVEWVAPHGQPGIVAVQLSTPSGSVRL